MMCISQRRVFDWVHLLASPSSTSSDFGVSVESAEVLSLSSRSTKQLIDPEIEKELYEWIQAQLPTKVSSSIIRNKAREMYRAKGYSTMQCSYGWYRRFAARFSLTNDPHKDMDDIILTWMLKSYDQNHAVSVPELQEFAQTNLSEIKPEFCASGGWAMRFLKRHHLILNWDDIYTGQLPLQLNEDAESFNERMKNDVFVNYVPSGIGSMDEIPLSFFDLYTTSDQMKVPRIRKYSITNCDATVILTLMADGNLLPPFVILKGQHQCDLFQVHSSPNHNSVVVYYGENTGPTISCLEKWHELIWVKNVLGNGKEMTLLLLDDYKLHDEFKTKYTSDSFNIEIFPSGCSSKLQPLNSSGIKREFLSCMEEFWLDYVRGNVETKMQLPSIDEIINWVEKSYEKVRLNKELLLKAFPIPNITTPK